MWINLVGLGVWASGLGWVVVHYLLRHPDNFGLPSNPSEPVWLEFHGAFAFLSVWTGGLLWGAHVVKAWQTRRNRWSGATLFGSLLVLMASGYLLYYVADERARPAISMLHWILGLAIPAAYLAHRLAKRFA